MWFRRILIAFVLFVLAVTVTFLVWKAHVTKDCDRVLAQLKAEGAVLDIGDLRSPRPEGTVFYSGPIEGSATAFLLSAEAAGSDSNVDARKWPWYETSTKAWKVFELTPEDQTKVLAVVRENGDLIAKLKRVSALPPTRMEDILRLTGTDTGSMADARLPSVSGCKAFCQLLMLDAYAAYQAGAPDEALKTCASVLQLGGHLRDVPDLITQGTGTAVGWGGLEFLGKLASRAEFSDEAILSFRPVLDEAAQRDSLVLGYGAETIAGRQMIRLMFDIRTGRSKSTEDTPVSLRGRAVSGWLLRPVWDLARAKDEELLVSTFAALAKVCRLPYYRAKKLDGEIVEKAKAKLGPMTFVTRRWLPESPYYAGTQANTETLVAEAKTALALKRYRKAQGSYPDNLEALVPAYLPSVPMDPFTGDVILYRKRGDSYVLCGAGYDETINLTEEDIASGPTSRFERTKDVDLVWWGPAAH